MKGVVLIVEDDIAFGVMLQSWFKKNGFAPLLCSKVEDAKSTLQTETIHLILSDYRLPDGNGTDLLAWLKKQLKNSNTPFIIMTSYAETQNVVQAMKLGAFDYLEKPINPSVLEGKITSALNSSATEPPKEKKTASATSKTPLPRGGEAIYGTSPASKQMYAHIDLVAPTHLAVLIRGESGTGKEYAARMIHERSKRSDKVFLALDCGSLSKELAPSELFGHLKGAFTSAIETKKGAFEQANGGTLFLDEIGNLSYEVQVQLLRAVQEMKVRPVGASTDITVDVRLIVATNENLETAIAEGRFREDLFHRLNEFTLNVPALRNRKEDLGLYANFFLQKANEELDKKVEEFSPECLAILQNYAWPGNLRELRNIVRRMVLFAQGSRIEVENIPESITSASNYNTAVYSAPQETLALKPQNERERILQAIAAAGGNKSLAAQMLKIDRKTLYNKIHQYGIEL